MSDNFDDDIFISKSIDSENSIFSPESSNYGKAFKSQFWMLLKAAKKGHAFSQYMVTNCYYDGECILIGIEKLR